MMNKILKPMLAGVVFLYHPLALHAGEPSQKLLYEFLFSDGSLANSGSVSGEAEEKSPSAGKPSFQMTQDPAFGNWVLSLPAGSNLQTGPYLVLPDSRDQVRLGDSEQQATFAFWVNWAGPIEHADPRQFLMSSMTGDYMNGWAISVVKNGAIRFDWTVQGGPGANRTTSATISGGEWHHIAVVWKNGPSVYIDGSPAALTMPVTGSQTISGRNSPVIVGADIGHFLPFRGSLAGIRIYDSALSVDEIFELSQKKP